MPVNQSNGIFSNGIDNLENFGCPQSSNAQSWRFQTPNQNNYQQSSLNDRGRGRGAFRGRGQGQRGNFRGRGNHHNKNGNNMQGKVFNKKEKIDKRDLPENNVFYCDTCDRGFRLEDEYLKHVAGHEVRILLDICRFIFP